MSKISTTVRLIKATAPLTSTLAPGLAARWLEQLFLTPTRRDTPAREQDWTATATRTALPYDTDRFIQVYSWGSGPVALLVHGWAGRGAQLGAFVEPLLSRGYRVVTYDAPGHGAANGRHSSLPELAGVLERVAATLGPVEVLVAHSLGTAATTIALSRGLAVQRAVYIAPPCDPPSYLGKVAGYLGFSEDVVDRTRGRIERRYGLPFDSAHGPTLASRLSTPLLIVHDVDDREVSVREGETMAASWPEAELVVTEGLGHHRILRDPGVVTTAVDFLTHAAPTIH